MINHFGKDYEGFICPSPEEAEAIIDTFKYQLLTIPYRFFPNDDEPRH